MMSISQMQLKRIMNKVSLNEIEQQIIRSHIRMAKVHKLNIRQNLCQEQTSTTKGYYLIQGRVYLSAILSNGEKAVLSEIDAGEFVNLQIMFNDWICKYTITVASPIIKFIVLEERHVIILANYLQQQINESISFRQMERQKRNRKIIEEEKKNKMNEQIRKLKLPDINYQLLQRYPNLPSLANESEGIGKTPIMTSHQRLPAFSRSLKTTLIKSGSTRSIEKPRHETENIEQDDLRKVQEKLLDHYHDYQDKITEKKLEKLKSERSIFLNEKEPRSVSYSRNQRLFKEQLKGIVKRKLIFEKKHFKILRRLNQKEQLMEGAFNPNGQGYGQQVNPIDNYFDL